MPRNSSSGGAEPASNGRNGHRDATPAGELQLSDFVERPQIEIDREGLRGYLEARTVLVTGAGGSVGTELAAQLLAVAPHRLVLADISEHNLFQLEQAFPSAPGTDIVYSLIDVQNTEGMTHLIERTGPDVVIHAAAYKHVPLIERHPAAGFRNNTLATARLLDVCEAHAVEQFVLISTDKAVAPKSVLGATKRLAEWVVRSSEADLATKIVRFGNVFGSRGSVIPQFQRQLAQGGPLEVTHPDMKRYFMSVDDASRLIIQTLLLDVAPIYALNMGEPVSILWIAREMVRRYVPNGAPEDWIVYTGKRPGEKFEEQLVSADETSFPTDHPHIMGLTGGIPRSAQALTALLSRLDERASHHPEALRKTLLELDTAARPSVENP